MSSGPIISRQIDEETRETVTEFIFFGSKITADGDCSYEIKRCLRKAMTILDSKHHFADKGAYVQWYSIYCSHVWMWELDHKEGWISKYWILLNCGAGEDLESLLNCKEVKPINHKRNQPWISMGRTNAEAEASVFSSPDVKRKDSLERTLMLGMTEDRRKRVKGDRKWDGWVASLTQWTWVWPNFKK